MALERAKTQFPGSVKTIVLLGIHRSSTSGIR